MLGFFAPVFRAEVLVFEISSDLLLPQVGL
jgi:hypothetical protein